MSGCDKLRYCCGTKVTTSDHRKTIYSQLILKTRPNQCAFLAQLVFGQGSDSSPRANLFSNPSNP
jgi:hypothetical protein